MLLSSCATIPAAWRSKEKKNSAPALRMGFSREGTLEDVCTTTRCVCVLSQKNKILARKCACSFPLFVFLSKNFLTVSRARHNLHRSRRILMPKLRAFFYLTCFVVGLFARKTTNPPQQNKTKPNNSRNRFVCPSAG